MRITRLLDKIIASLSYLLDCRLVFVPIFIFSARHIRALSKGKEVCVLGRKYEVLDKPKAVGIQTPAHHSATVLLHKVREIIRIDDSLFDTGCFHNPAFEPTVIDPLLHLVNSDVQASERLYGVNQSRPLWELSPKRCNMERIERAERCMIFETSSIGQVSIRSKSRCCSGFVHGLQGRLCVTPC
jgi:hypothetical protein